MEKAFIMQWFFGIFTLTSFGLFVSALILLFKPKSTGWRDFGLGLFIVSMVVFLPQVIIMLLYTVVRLAMT